MHATHVRTHGVSTPVARTAALNEAPRAQGTRALGLSFNSSEEEYFFGEPPWIWKAPLKGTVTAAVTGEPLAGVCVWASNEYETDTAVTASNGTYVIAAKPLETYTVHYFPCNGANVDYLSQWYDDSPSIGAATRVYVSAVRATEGIDAALVKEGSISGTVTGLATGKPVAEVCVDATSADGAYGEGYLGGTVTAADGTYTVTGLAADSYDVHFSPCGAASRRYFQEYYDGSSYQASATPVSVSAGENTTGIDATLKRGTTISGTVTAAATGRPAEGVCVTAFVPGGGAGAREATTSFEGTYTIEGLPPGTYNVKFSSCERSAGYVAQFYDGASSLASATAVKVTHEEEVEGINATLAKSASISGTVTDATTGKPVAGVCVTAFSSDGGIGGGTAVTAANGTYLIASGLAGEGYTVQFDPACGEQRSPYVMQWSGGAGSQSAAEVVSVASGSEATGVNASLARSGSIAGTVIDAVTGQPLQGVCVTARANEGGYSSGMAVTDAEGDYTIASGLAGGRYAVEFEPGCTGDTNGEYGLQWFDGASTRPTSTAVSLAGGAAVSGVNAALTKVGSISGTVTEAAGGTPLAGVCVTAVASGGVAARETGVSSTTGQYTITGVPAGSYAVEFDPSCEGTHASGLSTAWYGSGAATTVSVSAGAETTSVNGALAKPGSLSGTVSDAATGSPAAGVCVRAVHPGEEETSGFARTSAAGTYTISGLAPATYDVEFGGSCGGPKATEFVVQWSGDAANQQSAEAVSVGAGATTTANSALVRVGSITGTVTDEASGKPIEGVCVTLSTSTGELVGTIGAFGEAPTTQANGTYAIEGLPPGSYDVAFNPACPSSGATQDALQWYPNTSDEEAATPVSVSAGATSANIDAALQAGVAESGAPEFGRCVKMPGVKKSGKTVYEGGFSEAKCVTASATRTGKYEWHPGAVKAGFNTTIKTGTSAVLETTGKVQITCSGESGSGEVTGAKTVGGVTVRLTGCQSAGRRCTTPVHAEGEIESKKLEGTLGWIKHSGTNGSLYQVGLEYYPADKGGPVLEVSCAGAGPEAISGSVIVPVTTDAMATKATIKYKAKAGRQQPERFEGGEEALLTNAHGQQVGLSLTATLTNQEPLEINKFL